MSPASLHSEDTVSAARRRGSWHGVALFVVALLLRAGYAWMVSPAGTVPYSDPAHYDTIAWNLASGEGYALGTPGAARPTAYRPPLMPWITSLVYRVAGHRYDLAVQVQSVFGALVPVFVMLLGGALFGAAAGRLAGWITAVSPLIVFFSGHLLTENLFTALLLLGLVLSVAWTRRPTKTRALVTGVVWGLAALTRPVALLLPLVVLLWAWWPMGRAIGGGRRAVQAVALIAGLALTVAPWTVRNAIVMHGFVPVSTNAGRVLLEGYNPRSWDDPALRGGGAIDVTAEPYAALIALPEVEADRRSRAEAFRFARAHAAELPAMALAKLGRFWRIGAEGGGTGTWQRRGSTLGSLAARVDPVLLWSLLVFPFGLWGAWITLRSEDRHVAAALPLMVMVYFSMVVMVFWGGLRLRAPIEPLIVLMAAVGMVDMWRRLRRLGGKPAAQG